MMIHVSVFFFLSHAEFNETNYLNNVNDIGSVYMGIYHGLTLAGIK